MAEKSVNFGDNLKILRDNIRARIPDLMHGGLTFKKAKKEKTEELDVAKR